MGQLYIYIIIYAVWIRISDKISWEREREREGVMKFFKKISSCLKSYNFLNVKQLFPNPEFVYLEA